MNNVWTITRRELRGFFDHPTAYILAVAFLGLAFFLAFRNLYTLGVADLRSFFDFLPWLLAVYVPAVTMRALAEERSRGTLEWLVSQPITEPQLVAGKFLGCWLFVLATLAGTLPMAAGVLAIADAPVGPTIAQYIGGALLAAELTAVGLFASALTKNQITSFIIAAILSVALVIAGTGFTLVALPDPIATLVSRLAILPHFDSVARGVIDLRDALYFISAAGLFLGLAYFLVTRERLSHTRGAYRRLKTGIAAGALAVIVLNLVGHRIYGRLDLTADRLYTLADGTTRILGDLDDIVTIKLFVSSALPPELQATLRDVRDMLSDFRRSSRGNIRIVELRPDKDEDARSEATSLGIREVQFNVLRQDEMEIRSGWLALSVQYADERETIPFVNRTDDLEYRLISAIAAMTADRKPRVAFATGYGAHAPYQLPELNEVLSTRYDVRTVNLEFFDDTTSTLSPDSFDVVVVAGPTQPVSQRAIDALDRYLNDGGAALLFLENSQLNPQMPFSQPLDVGLGRLLSMRGLRLTEHMAYDVRSNQTVSLGRRSIFNLVAPYPLWPIAVPASEHATNRNLEMLSLGWAAVIEIEDTARVAPIWSTTEFGGRKPTTGPIDPETAIRPETIDPDALGRQVLAAAVLGTDGAGEQDGDSAATGATTASGRMIVVGDADMVTSQFVQGSPQNLAFAANAVDWLAQDESLIAIRSKDRTPPPLVFESDFQRSALRWGNMAGVPVAFVLLGLLRARVRRARADELLRQIRRPATATEEAS